MAPATNDNNYNLKYNTMNNLKLTDKELVLIINTLTDKIRYKGIQKLLVNMHNQLDKTKKTNKRNWFDFNKAHQKYLDKVNKEDEPCTHCGYYEDEVACHYEDCPTQLTDTE